MGTEHKFRFHNLYTTIYSRHRTCLGWATYLDVDLPIQLTPQWHLRTIWLPIDS